MNRRTVDTWSVWKHNAMTTNLICPITQQILCACVRFNSLCFHGSSIRCCECVTFPLYILLLPFYLHTQQNSRRFHSFSTRLLSCNESGAVIRLTLSCQPNRPLPCPLTYTSSSKHHNHIFIIRHFPKLVFLPFVAQSAPIRTHSQNTIRFFFSQW